MRIKYISAESLKKWLSAVMGNGRQVFAPVLKKGKAEFTFIRSAEEISFEHVQTLQSPKATVFPRAETLFSFKKEKNDVKLRNFDAASIPETVVFGLHPCDAAGFAPLSAIFNWDTKDKPFNGHLSRTVLVSVSCTRHDEYCFCTSVNGGPGNTAGSDLLLTSTPEGFIVEEITEKGKSLVEEYSNFFEEDKKLDKADFLTDIPPKFSLEELKGKLSHMFDSGVWKEQSERCLGCGACAFVCPTCACFDMQEDSKGTSGRRIRCWDSCGFSLFTLHTSGHNPREIQSQRWRQRLLHKFSYMPQRLSVAGCTGCGRCSRACPVDMNLCGHLTSIASQDCAKIV